MARSMPNSVPDTRPPLELNVTVKVADNAPLPRKVRKLSGGIGKLVDMFGAVPHDFTQFLVNFGSDEQPLLHPVTQRDLSYHAA